MEAPSLAIGQVYRNVVRSHLRYRFHASPNGGTAVFPGDDPDLPPVIDIRVTNAPFEGSFLVLVEDVGTPYPINYIEKIERVLTGKLDTGA